MLFHCIQMDTVGTLTSCVLIFFSSGSLVGHSGHVNSLYTKMDTGGMLFHCIQMDTVGTLTSCVLIFFHLGVCLDTLGMLIHCIQNWTQGAC